MKPDNKEIVDLSPGISLEADEEYIRSVVENGT
jgi:hypothetical protein